VAESSRFRRFVGSIIAIGASPDHRDPPFARSESRPGGDPQFVSAPRLPCGRLTSVATMLPSVWTVEPAWNYRDNGALLGRAEAEGLPFRLGLSFGGNGGHFILQAGSRPMAFPPSRLVAVAVARAPTVEPAPRSSQMQPESAPRSLLVPVRRTAVVLVQARFESALQRRARVVLGRRLYFLSKQLDIHAGVVPTDGLDPLG
jgi:hypothetical protein